MWIEFKEGKVVLRDLDRPPGDFADEALLARVRVPVERGSAEFAFGVFHPRDLAFDSVGGGTSVFINGLLAFHHPSQNRLGDRPAERRGGEKPSNQPALAKGVVGFAPRCAGADDHVIDESDPENFRPFRQAARLFDVGLAG